MSELKVCKKCVMDETDPNIIFDQNGYCNHCNSMISYLEGYPFSLSKESKKNQLKNLVSKIKKTGKNTEYDCIIGLSGGVDSSYVAYLVKELGLRPLAVHLDNGWNSELSVKNIENICTLLDIDLYTYVIDWEEFRLLQLAFLRASTPDSEIPSDHAIVSILFKIANKHKIKYIIAGTNALSEFILPKAWSQGHRDLKYIKSINKKFGGIKLKTYPRRSFIKQIIYKVIKRIDLISILDYVDYNKDSAKNLVTQKLNWKDYGYKHYESNYTRIYQSYILYEKFGIDKRKAHFSTQIISGQMSRETAIEELMKLPYDKTLINEDIKYLANKLKITTAEFTNIMNTEPKRYEDYPNNKFWMDKYLVYRKVKIYFINLLRGRKNDTHS